MCAAHPLVKLLSDRSPIFAHSGWFHGLSKRFLDCRAAKLLILAGTERLDKELMIGQMQGTLHPAHNMLLAC